MKSSLVAAAAIFSSACYAAPHPLEKRNSDYISSCGDLWMARDDLKSNHDTINRRGYLSAVKAFCDTADGKSVPSGGYLSMATRVYIGDGGDPANNGVNGYVFFEVHNKQKSGDHTINTNDCQDHYKQLSNDNSKCWGDQHHDTKGGTWQVGSDQVSYHALGKKVLPAQDAVDKLFDQGALSDRGGKDGTALDPFPLDFTADVTPVGCHSHNDYLHDWPLFEALTAGCISVEADVWLHGDNLRVSHKDPGDSGPTLQQLYLDPLKAMLDAQQAIYPPKKDQELTLLIDFKSDGDSTWGAVVNALAPLRDAGYLSHWDGSSFVQGPITIVASGNAPLAKAQDDGANPGRAMFKDAPINKPLDGYDQSNSYYASAKFSDAVTGSGDSPMSAENLQKVKDQVGAAHDKKFKVRYYDLPSQNIWQELFDNGVDRINVDNFDQVASMDWHLQ